MIGKSGAVVVISVVQCPGGVGRWFDSVLVQVFLPQKLIISAARSGPIVGTRDADTTYCTSRFFIEKAEGPGTARHPASCAFAPLCSPPTARPLPLHRPTPLRAFPLARTRPRWPQLYIPPQVLHPRVCFRDFRPLPPGLRPHPLPLPIQGLHMWGSPQKELSGLK